ncbi:PREDICTED: uncharacterized protein LOC106123799 [Papilio xuthus]|uniref:Uncharacterized protein LOC106123799 n=1 Tax=Papilio xuthus TaxID=66420 RepID=A0AAJ6ZMM9_PAPXU|nr:PREDICTED: uncharacterized protein LOC106123799 [Papilio xuthus]
MFKEDDDEEDNTFGVTRYPCMPSLVALQQMRNRLHLANLGKKLMKWTAVAAMTELRNIALQIDGVYKNFSEDMCEAFIMLARCRYFNPSLNEMVLEGCPNQAEICVTSSTRTASGVKIVKYSIIENNTHPYEHLGIGKGGQMILDTKKAWLELLKRIILMVELRKNFKLVEEMQKSANKKMNVLGKVVVPKCKATCTYIIDALEELARDEFYRRKMILEVKGKGGKDTDECSKDCSFICEEDENKPMRLAMNDHVKDILQLVNSIDDKKFSEADIKDFLELGEELKNKLYESIKPEPKLDEPDNKDNAKADIPAEDKVEPDKKVALPPDEKENMDPVEVEIKEITKIVRIRNKDGTYREVKKTIKIQKETKIIENASNISVPNDKMLYEPSTSSSKSTPSRETRIQMMKIKNCNIPTQQTKVQEIDKQLNTVLCDSLLLKNDLSESSLNIDMEYLKSKYFCTNCPICKELSSEVFKVQDIEELYEKYQLDEKNLFETEEMKALCTTDLTGNEKNKQILMSLLQKIDQTKNVAKAFTKHCISRDIENFINACVTLSDNLKKITEQNENGRTCLCEGKCETCGCVHSDEESKDDSKDDVDKDIKADDIVKEEIETESKQKSESNIEKNNISAESSGGYFERKVKTSKIKRFTNSDGTVREEIETTIVTEKIHDPVGDIVDIDRDDDIDLEEEEGIYIFYWRLNVLSKSVMPRAMLSIRYILFELEEMEREDNFRLKRFKELKIKKQSKDAADKEEANTDGKENVPPATPPSFEVKFDDKKEMKRPKDFNELGKINEEQEIPKEKIEEYMKEPNINFNKIEEKDTNELKNRGEYKPSNEDTFGNAPYFDETWNKTMDENICSCSPIFMSTQEVCQAEIPDQSFNIEPDKKIQDTKLPKEEEIKIPIDIPPCNSNIILTWLKKVLEEIIFECACNLPMNQKENVAACSQNIRKYSTEFSKLSIQDSTFSVNSKVENRLGSYESKYKEIIKVSRIANEDGTVRQKRKIVTVRTDKRNPMKTKSVNSQNANNDNDQNLECSCSDSSSESGQSCGPENVNDQNDNYKKPELIYQPPDSRSEPVCSKCLWDKPNLRSCISAGSMKNTKKMNTITCCYPSDRKVNIIINDKAFEENNNNKDTRLPLVSSISVNFCDLPTNILLDLRDSQCICDVTDQQNKCMVDADLPEIPEPKKSVSTCMCELLDDDDFVTADKCSESCNTVGVEVESMFKNAGTCMTNTAYIFNNIIVTNITHSEDRKSTALQSPDFSYIFSKVEKVRHDLLDKNIEESHPDLNTDFFKECSTRTTMFDYIFSSYVRNEIDNMVKRACFDNPEFPYIFSKISTKTPCIPCNTNSVEIGALFNNACKRSYSCTYIFNHLKNIQINAMIKRSCMNKVDFPYIFSTVKTEIEDQPNKDATLRTAEIENMFKNIRKPVTEFTYILNHVNTVKIDNMIKEACKHNRPFPYVFNNIINEPNSTDTLQKINEMFIENCKQPSDFPYIFRSSKTANTKNISKNVNEYSCTCSTISEAILSNDEECKEICKQTCTMDDELSIVFNNTVFKKSNFQKESPTRLKEISNLLKESVRSMNSGKYKFKYVYKNEVNHMDKKTSTDIIYIYTICDACTSTDNVDYESNKTGVTAVFEQYKHRSEHTYFPNEVECRKADIVQRASETTFQDIKQIFKGPSNCIFNKIDIKIPQKEEKRDAQCCTCDSINDVKRDDLEKASEILNVVDINTMFKDSCVRKNEFTYVLNKPTNKPSCELARRTTDLRIQQMSKFADSNNNAIVKKCESNQFTKTPNLIKIENMFKDSWVQKNSFTYVPNNLEDKVSCDEKLARPISDLRRFEVEKLPTNPENSGCGLQTCIVCNPDQCLNPSYIKIDKMIKKACKQKNEFTYVSTKIGKKPVQLARRTSHLRLHEISKINESKPSKTIEITQDTERSRSDFTCLLRKALESIETIKSNCEKCRNVGTIYDTCVYDNPYKENLNKIEQAKTSDFENANIKKKQEINKLIEDSCISPNPKYDYIFQKVPKSCICSCIKNNLGLKLPCSVSFTNNIYEEIKPCNIQSQSTCSFANKRKQRFLIHVPNDSGTLGIEVMWKSSGVTDKNIAPKTIHITTSKRSVPRICPGKSENKINKKKSWCRSTCSKTSKVPSENNDVSLIRRMIDSVKNVYVPFLKPSEPEVNKEVTQQKADNVLSLMSNSTTSTYSWKSCVMKTCQADIECVEKNISYSGFSFGSSLDFVSYKSEGVGSGSNSAIQCAIVEESPPCKHIKKSDVAEKLLTFDIEMNSGISLDTKDSVISVKGSHSIKFDPSASDHCQKCGRRKNKPKRVCSKCSLAQNQQVYRLNKSPMPSCTRKHIKNLLKRSCSCLSVSSPKYANEPKADYWYNLNKRPKFKCTSTECVRVSEQNVANKCKPPIRKCRSYDDNDCCCSKNARSFH